MWRRANRTVLIVSENPTEPGINSPFLRQPDIRLLTSYPDDEGLRLARRERPSLIIEDLSSADNGSLAFCRRLRSERSTRSIPLILVASPELRARASEAQADALLDKPLARREFFEAVRRFVPLPKRRTQRLSINLRFCYRLGETSCQVFTRDISHSGAFLKTDRIPPLGTRLDLHFRLPGAWEELSCRAIVRSTSHGETHAGQLSGFGVEFEDLSDADFDLLDTFIERLLKRSHASR